MVAIPGAFSDNKMKRNFILRFVWKLFSARFARKNVAYACATLCCLLWGSSYPALKTVMNSSRLRLMIFRRKSSLLATVFCFAGVVPAFALAQRNPSPD
jgi:hypothetical protein